MNTQPKILIIDDEFVIHKLFISLLSDEYTLLFASTGAQGLQILQKERPALAMLDYQLKDMNGEEFLAKLQPTDLIRTKIVMISGHFREVDLRPENRKKVSHFFPKPFLELQKMLDTIRHLIKKPY